MTDARRRTHRRRAATVDRPHRPGRIDRRHRPGRPHRPGRIDWSDDSGQVGGIEVLPFGMLVFVVGTLLVVNAWAVIDCKLAVDGATREAVRTYVESSDPATAGRHSDGAARDAIDAHGRDRSKLVVDPPAVAGGRFARCARVTIAAHYPVPWITLPLIGGRGEGLTVSSTHSELVDPYRSDVPGEATC